MTVSAYTLDPETRKTLGLVVLQADETIEDDFRRLFDPAHVRLHVSRVPSGAHLTAEAIREMEAALPMAAGLFPEGTRFDAVGFACTSGASLIGPERVAALVGAACQTNAVTNPLTAAVSALQAEGAQRIGLVSPYTEAISEALRADFERAGFIVSAVTSFCEEIEANVARIAPGSIVAAAERMANSHALDAMFLSCTNLRTLDVIAELRTKLDVPVLSSNSVLAWHMATLAGADIRSSLIRAAR